MQSDWDELQAEVSCPKCLARQSQEFPDALVDWMRSRGLVSFSDGRVSVSLGPEPDAYKKWDTHACTGPGCDGCEKEKLERIRQQKMRDELLEFAHVR